MKINCMSLHPGDYVLVESFDFPSRFKTRVKAVYENYIIDIKGNKLSYACLEGILLKSLDPSEYKDLGFLTVEYSNSTSYIKDRLQISIDDFVVIVQIGFSGKGKQTSDIKYLHEVQHFYHRETGKNLL